MNIRDKRPLGEAAVAQILQVQNTMRTTRKRLAGSSHSLEGLPVISAAAVKVAAHAVGVEAMLDDVRARILDPVGAASKPSCLPPGNTSQAYDALKIAVTSVMAVTLARLDGMYLAIQESLQTPAEPEGADDEAVRPGPGYELRKEANDEILAAVYAALDKVRADIVEAKNITERL